MPYNEMLIAPMRGELVALGAKELKSAGAVDEQLKTPGTTLLVVNSVCGCAAGRARPGIALALRNTNGRTRSRRCSPAPTSTPRRAPASTSRRTRRRHPSIGLFRDGKLVWMMERWQIEGQDAAAIAAAAEGGVRPALRAGDIRRGAGSALVDEQRHCRRLKSPAPSPGV